MRLSLEAERRLRVHEIMEPVLHIEAGDPRVDFSPLHMLAASLATCTVAVLVSWGRQAELALEGLELEIAWEYVDDPYRVGRFDMAIRWPGLPQDRRPAALRAAQHCTVEHTLRQPPVIETRIRD